MTKMFRCPNHRNVLTLHDSGLCSVCRQATPAQADAPPLADESDPIPVRFSECELPECGMWRRRAEHIDRCAYCDKGLLEHTIEAVVAGNGHSPSPPQPDDYAARRAEVARRRNPQPKEQWFWFGDATDENGNHHDEGSRGIARAVDRLSHFEPRCGVARWEP